MVQWALGTGAMRWDRDVPPLLEAGLPEPIRLAATLPESLCEMVTKRSMPPPMIGTRGLAIMDDLRRAAKDDEPCVRAGALYAMTLFPSEAAQDFGPFIEALNDPKEEVVLEGLRVLRLLETYSGPAIRAAAGLLDQPRWRQVESPIPFSVSKFLSEQRRFSPGALPILISVLPILERFAADATVRESDRESVVAAYRDIRSGHPYP